MKQRIGSVLLTLAMTLALLPAAAVPARAASATKVTTLSELTAALSGNADAIEISGVIEVDNNITVSRSVTFTGSGTLKPANNFTTIYGILHINGGSVAWDGPVIDFDHTAYGLNINPRCVYVQSGNFELRGGALRNGAQGVHVYGGAFTMNGGEISGNSISGGTGGGVYVGGSGCAFTMNGGSITGNSVTGGGGGSGVYVAGGTFIMNGGSISGNRAINGSGGGVYAEYGKFFMNGGSIDGNQAAGGGVYVNNAEFTMNAGAICENKGGNSYEGGVRVGSGGRFTMNGGWIGGNEGSPNDISGSGVVFKGGVVGTIFTAKTNVNTNGTLDGCETGTTTCTVQNIKTSSDLQIGSRDANTIVNIYSTDKSADNVANNVADSSGYTTHLYKCTLNGALTVNGDMSLYGSKVVGATAVGEGGSLSLYAGASATHYYNKAITSAGTDVYTTTTGDKVTRYGALLGSGNDARRTTVNDSGALAVYDGTLHGGVDVSSGGGKLTLYGAADGSSGALVTGGVRGGGVYVADGASFAMYGGSVRGNKYTASTGGGEASLGGGGVCLSGGAFALYGGAITRNLASSGSGGGVFVESGAFTMSGGSITGNKANQGGGVFVNAATTFKLSGAVTIKDNTLYSSTAANNVGVVSLTGESASYSGVVTIDGALSNSDPIGVTAYTYDNNNALVSAADYPVTFTSGWHDKMGDGTIADYFVSDSDSDSYTVALDEESRELQLQELTTRTVTFNSDGTVVDSQIVESGEKATRPANPTNGDSAFGGWVLESNGSPYDFDAAVTGDITLIAQWVDTAHAHDGATFVPLTRALFVNATADANSVPVKLNCDSVRELSYYTLAAGDYWLAGDVTLNHTLRIDKAVKLCLNGRTLTQAEDGANAIEIVADGTLDLYDEAGNNGTITHAINEWDEPFSGSGVWIGAGRTFTMHGGTISGNRSYIYYGEYYGGGVYVGENGTFNMSGGAITRNNARNGGGVYIGTDGAFTLSDGGAISENEGGGVYIDTRGAFTMTGGAIRENTDGGGVYVEGGAFNMSNGEIYNNTDGGVYVEGGMFTMNDGEIYGHHSTHGGGVYLADGTFDMLGGKIRDNKVDGAGGGVYVEDGTFNLSGGSITGNISYGVMGDGEWMCGGGVYVGTDGAFNMDGGSITGNISDAGGGVFVKGGTFTVSGTPSVTGNQAGECRDNEDGEYEFGTELDAANVGVVQGSSVITVDGLSGAASIGVTVYKSVTVDDTTTYTPVADADLTTPLAFTATNEGIESYKSYFSSDQTGRVIVVTDGPALALAPAYTVTFESNEGAYTSGYTAPENYTFGTVVTLPTADNISRTGYDFGGWFESSGFSGTAVSAITTTDTGDKTYYAKWTAKQYTVTLVNQGATTPGSESVTATYDAAMPRATMPTRTGYTFGGYYNGTNGGGTQYYTPDGESARTWNKAQQYVTLYAKWTANTYTVTLNKQEGTGGTDNVTATYGDAMPSATKPTRTGYTFGGYYDETNGNGTQYYTETGASARTWDKAVNATLYAKWTANYTVTFDSDGGSEVAPQTVASGGTATRPANPTKSGYTFNKWKLDEADYDFSTSVTGDVALKAVWTANPVLTPAPPSPSSDYTPSAPAAATVTVPVSGDESTVNVTVRVTSGGEATLTSANVSAALDGNDSTGTVAIDLGGLAREISSVTIPAAIVADVAGAVASAENATDSLTVKLTDGSVTFDAAAVESITAQSGGNDLKLNLDGVETDAMNGAQQSAVAGLEVAGVLDVYMTSNNVRISDFGGGSAEVRIPFTAPNGRTAAEYAVWYVAEDGAMTNQRARYDAEDACFVFTVTHFSNYVIAYGGCPQDETCPIAAFTDADPAAWYHDGVHWAIERGVMSGWEDAVTGRRVFAPDGDTSRAMVAVMLWRLEGEPPADAALTFDDVQASKWYSDAIRWAAGVGVITGWDDAVTGRPVFAPDDAVTREQLATMLWRYAKYKGADVSVGEDTNILSYGDVFDVSEWAISAMQWAVGSGAVGGRTDTTLDPKDNATRAEIATMMQRFCEKVVK